MHGTSHSCPRCGGRLSAYANWFCCRCLKDPERPITAAQFAEYVRRFTEPYEFRHLDPITRSILWTNAVDFWLQRTEHADDEWLQPIRCAQLGERRMKRAGVYDD